MFVVGLKLVLLHQFPQKYIHRTFKLQSSSKDNEFLYIANFFRKPWRFLIKFNCPTVVFIFHLFLICTVFLSWLHLIATASLWSSSLQSSGTDGMCRISILPAKQKLNPLSSYLNPKISEEFREQKYVV